MDTEQEDVKLQIEDDPEAGTEERRKVKEEAGKRWGILTPTTIKASSNS